MAVIVQKYGGTSVGSLSRIEAVADSVISTVRQGHQVVVVLSAMSGETNRLVSMAKQLDAEPATRELDMLMASGEQVSISLLTIALIQRGFSAISLLAHQLGIQTDNHFGRARIQSVDDKRLLQSLEQGQVVVVAGFQGIDSEKNITTLGRGGSDTSAVAIAVALKASECQIFTDVDAIYSADPRIVPDATKIDHISFEEMLVMASLGAKVLQNRAVEYACNHQMPLRVLSSFKLSKGTRVMNLSNDSINDSAELNSNQPISSLAHQQQEALVSIDNIKDDNILASLFNLLGDEKIEIDMLAINAINSGAISAKFTVDRANVSLLKKTLLELEEKKLIGSILVNEKVAKISAIGIGLNSNATVTGTIFTRLAKEQVKILLISCSEIRFSVIIDESLLIKALRSLHSELGLHL